MILRLRTELKTQWSTLVFSLFLEEVVTRTDTQRCTYGGWISICFLHWWRVLQGSSCMSENMIFSSFLLAFSLLFSSFFLFSPLLPLPSYSLIGFSSPLYCSLYSSPLVSFSLSSLPLCGHYVSFCCLLFFYWILSGEWTCLTKWNAVWETLSVSILIASEMKFSVMWFNQTVRNSTLHLREGSLLRLSSHSHLILISSHHTWSILVQTSSPWPPQHCQHVLSSAMHDFVWNGL